MLLKLVTVPDSKLRQVSQPVAQMNTKNVQFLKDMANTLLKKDDPPGVGLSAIQVGTPARIFMTYLPPINDLKTLDHHQPPPQLKIFINPQIIDASEKLTLGPDKHHPALEGCLSIPHLYGPVYRHQTIKIRYKSLSDAEVQKFVHAAGPHEVGASTPNFDLESLPEKTEVFSHFFARVIQHEYDHLEGILFTDYTKKDNLPLYFDNGQNLIPIDNPLQLINW